MRILVTGGTGFVGAHCVRALRAAGHEITLLVRDPARVDEALQPLGVATDHCAVVTGDVLDDAAVRRGLSGADALLHAANIYSLNAADGEVMQRVNGEGTRRVLRAAVDEGLDPVVHVSSIAALLPGERLTSRSPLGAPYGPYQTSKTAAEASARALQDEGAPVVITNPGSVFGPHDPHLGESAALVRDILRGKLRVVTRGALPVVDVRDLAAAHARLFTAGSGPRRYLMGGHLVPFPDLFRLLSQVTGRRLPRLRLPARTAFVAGRMGDVAQRCGVDLGFSSAGVWSLTNLHTFEDVDTRRELGVDWRPATNSLRDTVAWLHDQRKLSTRQAGLAGASASQLGASAGGST